MASDTQARPDTDGGDGAAGAIGRIAEAARVRERVLASRAEADPEGAARMRLSQEIAALRDRIVLALAEAQDVLHGCDLILRLEAQDRPLAAAALFRILVVNAEAEEAFVDLAVEVRGGLHAVFEAGGRRETLAHANLGDAGRPLLLQLIAALLERFTA